MTNITKLYQQLQEGKTTRDYFVREARRQFPQFISPVSSYNDIVSILKGKRLVSENLTKEVSGAKFDAIGEATADENLQMQEMSDSEIEKVAYQLGIEDSIVRDGEGGIANAEEMIELIKQNRKESDEDAYGPNDGPSHPDRAEASWLTEANVSQVIKPLQVKLESMGYDVDYDHTFGFLTFEAFKTLPDGSILRLYLSPSDKELQQKNYSGRSEDFSTIDVSFTHWTTEVTDKLFGLYKQKTRVMKNLPDSEGENIDLGIGMFDIPVEQSVEKIIALVKRAEQKVTSVASQLQEAHKLDTEQILDRMSPYAVKKGVEVELKKEKVVDKDTLNKVKTRVAKKLQKNKDAYNDQVVSNVKEVEKQDKELEAKEVKQDLVDKKNAMRKPKGFKADKANTKASKRENKKGKPKGVKVMPDKGVTGSEKVLKEDVLEHLKQYIRENVTREYHVGMEVLTPDGAGVVKEVVGGTLTIEMMQGDVRDYQFNVVNKAMDKSKEPEQPTQQEPAVDPDKAARDAAFAKLPNLGSVRGKDGGPLSKMYKSMTFEEKLKLVIEKFSAIKDEAKKAKIMEKIDNVVKEAKKIKAAGETFIKSNADAVAMQDELRKAGVRFTVTDAR